MHLSSNAAKAAYTVLLLLTAGILLAGTDIAAAQNSLGIGRPEQAIKPEGPLASLLFWIQQKQQGFYQLMTGELKEIRADGKHVWLLAGLSFLYGVFHAAGPGHGKAVISSFMLANEVAAKRGIALAFASAFLQAISAILVIVVLLFFLRGLGLRQGDVTRWLEISSYAAVTALGAWLLFTKITGRGGHCHGHSHGHSHVHDHSHVTDHAHDHSHVTDHAHDHSHVHALAHAHADGHSHSHSHSHAHDHGHHSHAPDPAMLEGELSLRQAWGAILAVGLRPCSGAIIVLTFAFLNGLYVAGIASTFAMAAGTGLTVATLAALAVWSKDVAISLGGASGRAEKIHRAIEIAGAAMVFVFGLLFLSASLY